MKYHLVTNNRIFVRHGYYNDANNILFLKLNIDETYFTFVIPNNVSETYLYMIHIPTEYQYIKWEYDSIKDKKIPPYTLLFTIENNKTVCKIENKNFVLVILPKNTYEIRYDIKSKVEIEDICHQFPFDENFFGIMLQETAEETYPELILNFEEISSIVR